MKLYDKNAVAKFLDMTPKNVERLTQKGILQTKQGNLYALAETNRAYIKYLRDRHRLVILQHRVQMQLRALVNL